MSFFSPSFAAPINQPKMRQEGFHLPSPTPSNGNPPSPPSAGFDIFMPHHSSHQTHPSHANGNSHFPNLSLPDAFSRSGGGMDFGDELASLMASSPATSNERSTHTPPHTYDSAEGYRPTHNIFDISAPSTHYSHHTHAHGGAHAFSLPHATHRPELPLSQPSSLHSPHHFGDHHNSHHHGLGRDGFTGHFNSTIPPLSTHHDAPAPDAPQHYTYSNGARDTPSPSSTNAHLNGGSSRPDTAHGRSSSRSRSRTGGPTRTTKTANKRRDSLSLAHPLAHSLGHGPAGLPSPPGGARPQAIVIPSHAGRGPVSPMGLVGAPAGVGQTSGWFLPNQGGAGSGGGEFSLPTPESVGGGHGHAFGQFGTSMGISPKDTSLGHKGESPPIDAASKQAALVSEKRRRRRESHNAVERRRRDNINEKISELATLIPEVMLDPSAPSSSANANDDLFAGLSPDTPTAEKKENAASGTGSTAGGDDDGKEGGPVKANKGMILRKSVDYIRYLQQLVNAQAVRNRDLEIQLARATGDPSGSRTGATGGKSGGDGAGGAQRELGEDVLNLHSFGPDGDDMGIAIGMNGMGMGLGGGMGLGMGIHHVKGMMDFEHLEPMAESNEMEMDDDLAMDQDADGDGEPARRRARARREREASAVAAGGADADKADTSPSASAPSEDGTSASPRDAEDEAEEERELEERGRRRGRDAHMPNGNAGAAGVKEEGDHMDV